MLRGVVLRFERDRIEPELILEVMEHMHVEKAASMGDKHHAWPCLALRHFSSRYGRFATRCSNGGIGSDRPSQQSRNRLVRNCRQKHVALPRLVQQRLL